MTNDFYQHILTIIQFLAIVAGGGKMFLDVRGNMKEIVNNLEAINNRLTKLEGVIFRHGNSGDSSTNNSGKLEALAKPQTPEPAQSSEQQNPPQSDDIKLSDLQPISADTPRSLEELFIYVENLAGLVNVMLAEVKELSFSLKGC